MFNLQGSEIIVILLVALVVLGPEKLPDAVRRASRTYHELKKMGTGFQSELKAALDEPMREMRETADLVRDAADPRKLTAEQPSSTSADSPSEASPDTPPATTAEVSAPSPDDEVLGEMWEDEALYPGSSTVGTPPPAVTAADTDTDTDTEDDTEASTEDDTGGEAEAHPEGGTEAPTEHHTEPSTEDDTEASTESDTEAASAPPTPPQAPDTTDEDAQ